MTKTQERSWRVGYIALGANLGDAQGAFAGAIETLSAIEGIEVLKRSALYKTSPVDSTGPDYVNAVLTIKTNWDAEALMKTLLATERDFGRVRPQGVINAPRTLDLDLLILGDERVVTPVLTLPHPRMEERLFVLVPLRDVHPGWVSSSGKTIDEQIEILKTRYPDQKVIATL